MQVRAIVVEDETLTRHALAKLLRAQGWKVFEASDSAACNVILREEAVDLALVDLGLPGQSGQELIRDMASGDTMAILAVTAQWHPEQRIAVLDAGADDYVTKPFPMSVFQKKLSVVLGRLAKQSGGGDCYEDSALSINFSEMTASLSGKALVFTPLEYRLLKILTKNPQNVLTRQVLLEKLWDADGNFVDEHALTAAISRVRNKIETEGCQYIKTVYGMGYMWIGGASK